MPILLLNARSKFHSHPRATTADHQHVYKEAEQYYKAVVCSLHFVCDKTFMRAETHSAQSKIYTLFACSIITKENKNLLIFLKLISDSTET
jgi:hypothetical protein